MLRKYYTTYIYPFSSMENDMYEVTVKVKDSWYDKEIQVRKESISMLEKRIVRLSEEIESLEKERDSNKE